MHEINVTNALKLFSYLHTGRHLSNFRRTFSSHRERPADISPATAPGASTTRADFDDDFTRNIEKIINNQPTSDKRTTKNASNKTATVGENFDDFVAENIRRARRSILVRFAAAPNSYDAAYAKICRQLRQADININSDKQHQPAAPFSPDGLKTFFLLETTDRAAVDRFVKYYARSAVGDDSMQPCRTRILHFTNVVDGNNSIRNLKPTTQSLDALSLRKALKNCVWVEEQMRVLVDHTSLTNFGVHMRFFVASLIEDALQGIFPVSLCTPFGSTTNGFGHLNSDLDMDLTLEDPQTSGVGNKNWLCAYQSKDEDGRRQTQLMVELLGRMLRCCMPYCSDVVRITRARVPIVKFNHKAGGFGCDLTTGNMTGPAFSKILWTYSRYDRNVRPLAFAVRRWAASIGLTRDAPGDWVTNFQLLCLLIFYLQSRPSGLVLPNLHTLRRLASSNDAHGIVGNPNRLSALLNQDQRRDKAKSTSPNSESITDVLRGFFKFYAQEFSFEDQAISLETGTTSEKIEKMHVMHVHNPLEYEHNIAKNVTANELARFRKCAASALRIMEQPGFEERSGSSAQDSWGLLSLFDASLYDV